MDSDNNLLISIMMGYDNDLGLEKSHRDQDDDLMIGIMI